MNFRQKAYPWTGWVTFYLLLIPVESRLKEMRLVGIGLKNLRPDK